MNLCPKLGRFIRLSFRAAILTISFSAVAQSPSPVAYTVSLASPEQHLVEVQIILPAGPAPSQPREILSPGGRSAIKPSQ